MRARRAAIAALLAAAAGVAWAQHGVRDAPDDPLAGFGWFGRLAGACWKGDTQPNGVSDTQCYSTQYGQYIRGTIEIRGLPSRFEGDSVFAWDAKRRLIEYTQWSSGGTTRVGEAAFDGEALVFPDALRPGALAPKARNVWRRIDDDSFRVTRERNEDGQWKEAFTVVYRRQR